MKKLKVIVMILMVSVLCVACSSKEKEEQTAEAAAGQAEVEYGKHLGQVFTTSEKLLSSLNSALDGLYKGTTSEAQLKKILSDNVIDDSRELVKTVESFDVDPSFYAVDQLVSEYINMQHYLFQDAMEMVNQEKLDKDKIRKSVEELKAKQSEINNQWQQL